MIVLPDLSAYTEPEWNRPDSIAEAFASAMRASDAASSSTAYNLLLYALGNNHAGTYYSVALGVLPVMQRVLLDGSPWAQRTVLEALIDLCGSFRPEPGHETYRGQPLAELIRHTLRGYVSVIESLARDEGIAAKSAKDLLDALEYREHRPNNC
jgi:hypothetical protein